MEWKTATTKLDNLTDAEKQLVAQQETIWKTLLGILPESTYLYNPNMAESVRNAITRSGVSMEKFVNTNYKASHGMASAEEIAWLQNIVTKYFPKPEKEERLRKVITIETMEKWQLGKNNPNFKGASLLKNGFLTKSKDYITPRSTEELIENLRLDYKNSSFSKNEGFVVIEFKSDDAFEIDHAFNTSQNNNPLPYTNTGMTGSKRNIIPEYVNQNDITFKGGETMTVYDNKGNIVSKYEYKYDKIKDEGKWEKE